MNRKQSSRIWCALAIAAPVLALASSAAAQVAPASTPAWCVAEYSSSFHRTRVCMHALTSSEHEEYSDRVARCYAERAPESCVAAVDRSLIARDGRAMGECGSMLSSDERGLAWCFQEVGVQIAGRIGISACYASSMTSSSGGLSRCIDAETAAAADGTYGGKNIATAWTAACYAEFGPGANYPDPAMLEFCLNF